MYEAQAKSKSSRYPAAFEQKHPAVKGEVIFLLPRMTAGSFRPSPSIEHEGSRYGDAKPTIAPRDACACPRTPYATVLTSHRNEPPCGSDASNAHVLSASFQRGMMILRVTAWCPEDRFTFFSLTVDVDDQFAIFARSPCTWSKR